MTFPEAVPWEYKPEREAGPEWLFSFTVVLSLLRLFSLLASKSATPEVAILPNMPVEFTKQ